MFPLTVTSLRRTLPLPETRTEAPPVEVSLSTKKSPDPLTPVSKSSQEILPIRTFPDPLTLPSKSSQASLSARMLPLPLHWTVKSRLSISPMTMSPLPETFKAREPEACRTPSWNRLPLPLTDSFSMSGEDTTTRRISLGYRPDSSLRDSFPSSTVVSTLGANSSVLSTRTSCLSAWT